MVEAVESGGRRACPSRGSCGSGCAETVARASRDGEIGDLLVLHQTCRWSIAEDWYRSGKPGWFADPAHVPGGAFIDEGIYWIDFFRWLTGSEIVQVEARMANLVHKDIAVEDWGMATFTFANGVIATLEASWTINAPRRTGPSPKQNSVVRLEVIGTRGEIIDQSFRAPGRGGARRRRRRLGVRAAGRAAVRAAGAVPAQPPDRLPRHAIAQPIATIDGRARRRSWRRWRRTSRRDGRAGSVATDAPRGAATIAIRCESRWRSSIR